MEARTHLNFTEVLLCTKNMPFHDYPGGRYYTHFIDMNTEAQIVKKYAQGHMARKSRSDGLETLKGKPTLQWEQILWLGLQYGNALRADEQGLLSSGSHFGHGLDTCGELCAG